MYAPIVEVHAWPRCRRPKRARWRHLQYKNSTTTPQLCIFSGSTFISNADRKDLHLFEIMTTALSSTQDEIELQNSDPVPPADSQCNVCQKPAAFMCSSCGLNGPRYCSTECQSQGWREGHYRLCQGNAQARANAASRASNNIPEPAAAAAPGSIPMVELGNNETSTEQDEQQEFADELRFYIKQIYLVIQPVVICIILSIFWVKVAFSGTSDYTPVRPSYSIGTSPTTTSGGSDSSSSSAISSLTTALVIVGQIILVTLVIVFLFRRGWIKVGAKDIQTRKGSDFGFANTLV